MRCHPYGVWNLFAWACSLSRGKVEAIHLAPESFLFMLLLLLKRGSGLGDSIFFTQAVLKPLYHRSLTRSTAPSSSPNFSSSVTALCAIYKPGKLQSAYIDPLIIKPRHSTGKATWRQPQSFSTGSLRRAAYHRARLHGVWLSACLFFIPWTVCDRQGPRELAARHRLSTPVGKRNHPPLEIRFQSRPCCRQEKCSDT